jgi:hypothetical protein
VENNSNIMTGDTKRKSKGSRKHDAGMSKDRRNLMTMLCVMLE